MTATRLVIILTDDAIKHAYVWPLISVTYVISKSRTIHRYLFNDFSPFPSPVEEKGKQGRIIGLTNGAMDNS